MENNYYVSATDYGWGPDAIGDLTDTGHWWNWFRSDQSATYTAALYTEYGQNMPTYSSWPRLATDPGGENQIVLFKSCYPNSNILGSPNDPPTTGDNPMRGAWAGSDTYTVGNAKGIYNDLLVYFATRQDKLFILITAPPLMQSATTAGQAANVRALNNWLVNDWLATYPYKNVAVFDFYNVLTSNGGSPDINDVGSVTGNHHRWWNGAIQHIQTVNNNYSMYPNGDSHPTYAGNQKATAEFIQLLNVYYHRWADPVTETTAQSIDLVVGWNLVSFNLRPTSTAVADVLQSVSGNYDLVYAWNATSGNWLRADNIPVTTDTLTTLQETQGFWIHMLAADTLAVTGSVASSTTVPLVTGWNLVGYPSATNRALPDALSANGLGTGNFLIFAYLASDTVDPWKMYDRTVVPFSNDLLQMTPGWGYWIQVPGPANWNVAY